MKQNFRLKRLGLFIAAVCGMTGVTAAHAGIGLKAGDWDIDFSGNVNGFATFNSCDDKNFNISGGLACNKGPGGTDATSIESGLLPSAMVFSAKTRQANMDVGVTIGMYPTLRTNPGTGSGNTALGNSQINVRQNFLFFGDKSWGQVKIGRDIGLFASDAILNDMTLLGVGSGAAFLGGETTLGRIGVGYIYTDWIPQITYSSPDFKTSFGTFNGAVGMFQSLDVDPMLTNPTVDTSNIGSALTHHDTPGFQAKLGFTWTGSVGGKLWVSGMTQEAKSDVDQFGAGTGVQKISGSAVDVGGKVDFNTVPGTPELLAYYYTADGIGTTAIGFGAGSFANGSVDKRKSDGWFGQATWKLPFFQQIKLGLSYGRSHIDLAGNESEASNPHLLKDNTSFVGGIYYAFTQSLNLVAEYITTEAKAQNGDKIKDNAFALGAILFY